MPRGGDKYIATNYNRDQLGFVPARRGAVQRAAAALMPAIRPPTGRLGQ
jgi:hypothetical protein